jgi:CheY-like chemotaxis protein
MDGYRVTEVLRAHERADEHHVVIALTANALAGAREQCIGAGMDEFISKPIALEELSRQLASAREIAVRARSRKMAAPAPALDRRVLEATGLLDPDNRGLLESALTSFLADAWSRLTRLERILEKGGTAELRTVTHALLGSARQIGALRLAHTIEEMLEEECLRRPEMCRFLLSRLRYELGQLSPEIEALLAA